MKVYLDDERKTPNGWVRAYWHDEVVKLLKTGEVTELSLDHDLGNDERGTGYDVLVWLEYMVFSGEWKALGYPLPYIKVHSQNPVGVEKMEKLIHRIWCEYIKG